MEKNGVGTLEKSNGHKTDVVVPGPKTKEKGVVVTIKAPNFQVAKFKIIGEDPLVIHAFSAKARQQMKTTQEAGQTAQGKKKREPKDFNKLYNEARHISTAGWDGLAAGALRAAMISACKVVGYKMTWAKLAIKIIADGSEKGTGMPLVRIYGTPEKHLGEARNDNGAIDLRVRPMWKQWHAFVRVRYDADMLTLTDVTNLLTRAGMQVGVGEGRPDSKNSAGCNWGTFTVETPR